MVTLVHAGFAIFFFLLSFQSLLGWQVPRRNAFKIRHASIVVSVDQSQMPRINRSLRSAFTKSDEEEALGTVGFVS